MLMFIAYTVTNVHISFTVDAKYVLRIVADGSNDLL